MPKLSDHYFGDLEAYDEAQVNYDFFNSTFVTPSSMSQSSLRNDRRFIIVGRKGVGKTAVQMKLARDLEAKGYFTHHFRFSYDLRSDDYAEISRTQSDVSFTSVANEQKLFLHYDFRDVWERVILRRIAEKLAGEGYQSAFTNFCAPGSSRFKSIFQGILKSLRIKLEAPMGPALASINVDLSEISSGGGEISLKTYNQLAREIWRRECQEFQFYFFIDELVFSRLDARPDEVTLRAAMVRDLLRAAWELNIFAAKNSLAFHFVCSLRPEVRTLIHSLDSESGKFLDGKDVDLSWLSSDGDDGRLIGEVLKAKIEYSHHSKPKFDSFITDVLTFSSRTTRLSQFVVDNTWGRPRDIVRLLLSIAKRSPGSDHIGEAEVKAALDDYSRASTKELVDELSVRFGREILFGLRQGINRRVYNTREDFVERLAPFVSGVPMDVLFNEMFIAGIFGGYEPDKGRYYYAHRGETYFKPHHKVRIHPALWNEFSIRSS